VNPGYSIDAHAEYRELARLVEYRGAFYGLVTGAAKYSRYREFRVETSESIKH
jgi:hypothetical protein